MRTKNGLSSTSEFVYLGRWHDRECAHHAIGVLLTNLGNQKSSHTGTSASSERVGDLETLEAVAGLGLLADDVEDRVNKLGTLGVVALGPVVAGTALAKDEVVRAEELAKGTGADGVDGAGLQVDEDGAGDVLVARGLVVVDVDALELQVRVTVVDTGVVDAVLVADNLPELASNLVTALTGLQVDNLTHVDVSRSGWVG